eukprot:12402241-Karenia_brevis.AAC.1
MHRFHELSQLNLTHERLEALLSALQILVDDDFSYNRFVLFWNRYTLVTFHDGVLVDQGRYFIKHGFSAAAYFMLHLVDVLPDLRVLPAGVRRQGRPYTPRRAVPSPLDEPAPAELIAAVPPVHREEPDADEEAPLDDAPDPEAEAARADSSSGDEGGPATDSGDEEEALLTLRE